MSPLQAFLLKYAENPKALAAAGVLGAIPAVATLKSALDDPDQSSTKLGVKAGLSAALPVSATALGKNLIREAREESLPSYKNYANFHSSTKPGDIIFTKDADKNWYKDLIELVGGSDKPHVGLSLGKNEEWIHAPGAGELVKEPLRYPSDYPIEAIAYRPKAAPADTKSAVKTAKEFVKNGAQYEDIPMLAKRAAKMALGIKGSHCGKVGDYAVCTDVPTAAYPQLFNDQKYLTSAEIMNNPNFEAVSKLSRNMEPLSLRTKVMKNIGYPLFKGIAPALAVGGATALGTYLYKKAHES